MKAWGGGGKGKNFLQVEISGYTVFHLSRMHMYCSEYVLVDPTLSEEAVMDGRMVVGMNIHREICALQMSGGVALLPELV